MQRKFVWRVLEALLYGVYVTMSYFAMLVAMTYNVGLFISVIFGFCIGHFLFPRGPKPSTLRQGSETVMYSTVEAVITEEVCH